MFYCIFSLSSLPKSYYEHLIKLFTYLSPLEGVSNMFQVKNQGNNLVSINSTNIEETQCLLLTFHVTTEVSIYLFINLKTQSKHLDYLRGYLIAVSHYYCVNTNMFFKNDFRFTCFIK